MSEPVPDILMARAFNILWSFHPKTHWCSTKAEREIEMKGAVAIGRAILAERERCIRIISCGCGDTCGSPGNCSKDDIEAIRSEP